jgi:predicted anti-sigma-YlaC factor YlaD
MKRPPTPLEPCLWASQRLSLRLDDELSEFEQARLDEHLRSCADCRAYAAQLHGLTETLRSAPQEEPSVMFQLPRRRPVGAYALRAVSATAAVAVMAISGLVGLSGFVARSSSSGRAATVDVRAARQRMVVKERLLDNLEAVSGNRRQQIRPSLARVEQVTAGTAQVSRTVLGSPNEGR